MSAQNGANGGSAMIPSTNPLECAVPEEIPLARPPLQLALAQIQFPPILAINQDNSPIVAKFQDFVRKDYPDYQEAAELAVAVTPMGASPQPRMLRHIFKDGKGWEISLTQNFVALATSHYRNKNDFARKVENIAEAVRQNIGPHRANRLGIRFIDRIEDEYLENIHKYVNPEFLGPHTIFGKHVQSLMTEALLTSVGKSGTMIARWGFIPPNQPIPGINILPNEKPSWILDADIHTGPYMGFEPKKIATDTETLTGRVYAFFRSVFNDHFIRSCGGKL